MTLTFSAAVAERGVQVSFEVASGETLALVGPNGAGKSTVLQVAAGLLRPDRAEVVLEGRTLTSVGPGVAREVLVAPHDRHIAMLSQDALLFPHLTVLDNVAFGPRSRGAGKRQSREAAGRWLAEVDAGQYADRRPSQLSGGQAQRVAIARALAGDPRLLLLDEPLAALDVAVAPAVRQTLRRVLEGRTAVIVTHDVLDALLLADRVAVLEQGRVVEEGPGARVLRQPTSAFAARLAGFNLVAGTWRDSRLVAADGRAVHGHVTEPAPREGDPVVAVFRPAAVGVFTTPPGGSPRNRLDVTITDLEPRGDQIRVHAGDLTADITPQAAAELDLAPGARVQFAVKSAEVDIYPT